MTDPRDARHRGEAATEAAAASTDGALFTDSAPFTDASRARVVLAYEAYELADLARAAVPIGAGELCPDGTVRSPGIALADAARLLGAARQLLEAAAVFERVGGASWQRVGEVLGVSAQAARARFGPAEARFRDGRRSPGDATAGCWRAYLAREPLEAALDLDDWILRHATADGDRAPGPAPVSGGLVRADHDLARKDGDLAREDPAAGRSGR
ncbi:hypothetical protein [Streptomyces sp. YU58]|uniref:hypothetical protein n=1 Tax=Streptomyces sp. SX92 TaxID=3158972 RepID=UPI0027B947C6|nr:hypothetical protein [Streptomyces coralus]WLW57515.1 hypothetical protein QU709_41840 [Streptomyces coralus]